MPVLSGLQPQQCCFCTAAHPHCSRMHPWKANKKRSRRARLATQRNDCSQEAYVLYGAIFSLLPMVIVARCIPARHTEEEEPAPCNIHPADFSSLHSQSHFSRCTYIYSSIRFLTTPQAPSCASDRIVCNFSFKFLHFPILPRHSPLLT